VIRCRTATTASLARSPNSAMPAHVCCARPSAASSIRMVFRRPRGQKQSRCGFVEARKCRSFGRVPAARCNAERTFAPARPSRRPRRQIALVGAAAARILPRPQRRLRSARPVGCISASAKPRRRDRRSPPASSTFPPPSSEFICVRMWEYQGFIPLCCVVANDIPLCLDTFWNFSGGRLTRKVLPLRGRRRYALSARLRDSSCPRAGGSRPRPSANIYGRFRHAIRLYVKSSESVIARHWQRQESSVGLGRSGVFSERQ